MKLIRPAGYAPGLIRCALGLAAGCATSAVVVAAPDLVCEIRYASESRIVRQPVSADPYAARPEAIGERFALKAVVLGGVDQIDSITLTVFDLSVDGAPVITHQARYLPPFNMHPELPALTGWNHVYSSVYGREFRYGCALQANEVKP
jgi:hypothetical protein